MAFDRSRHWYSLYGKIGNRPLHEIRLKANFQLIRSAMNSDFQNQRYVENLANKKLGYCDGERAVLLTSIEAKTAAEILFSWEVEMRLADCFRKLDKVIEGITSCR